ncbi:hypothetical protein [Clostridium manihotivorum]|uniref:Uncharacterized protein n=1 Tax=Clostridium manihotivorum TaxID=2320868 RepID=A0A410DPH5_9CLOT|nr:hypothetical protein [Clostridium manihotivorum]QAA30957.1 hypothetical protein C1I91_04345 [Clostridium manihotivorum]
MIKLTDLRIPLEIIFKNDTFILLNVKALKQYSEGKITDRLIGYSYEVVDLGSFEKFQVKVLGEKEVITQQYIDNSENRLKVTFGNAIAKPYRSSNGNFDLSISADSINVLEN